MNLSAELLPLVLSIFAGGGVFAAVLKYRPEALNVAVKAGDTMIENLREEVERILFRLSVAEERIERLQADLVEAHNDRRRAEAALRQLQKDFDCESARRKEVEALLKLALEREQQLLRRVSKLESESQGNL